MLCSALVLISCLCAQVLTDPGADTNEFSTFFRKEYSLIHPYQGRGMQVANWDYTGSTLITKDFVRLTPDRQARRGFNYLPAFSNILYAMVFRLVTNPFIFSNLSTLIAVYLTFPEAKLFVIDKAFHTMDFI